MQINLEKNILYKY